MEKSEINIDEVVNKIQLILNKTHTVLEKRKIKLKLYGQRPLIEFACPICGDSQKNMGKKRGNLFLNNMFYVCFNCGDRMSYIRLLERFGVEVDLDEKLKIYDYVDQNVKYSHKSNDYNLSSLDKILNLQDTFDVYNERKDELYDIKPIERLSAVYQYLKFNRKIENFDNIYEGTYKITDRWKESVMIILNRYQDKLLGFQLRNLKEEKKKRIYKIYDFETIYNYINEDKIDNIEAIQYNKLSHFYNIFNVDPETKINVFEGYIDSIFLPNSIGTTGVDTDYGFLMDNDELDIRFFYDNDEVGKRKTLQRLEEGYSVFLWNKLFGDISKNNTKKEFFLKNNIKDLNDFVKFTKSNNVSEEYKLEDYFSIDEFDKLYI